MNELFSNLRSTWKSLVLADLLCKTLTFTLLTPTVSLIFHTFLALSGRSILADTDIAKFLLHPIGWIALVVVGGASVGIFLFEQAVLITIVVAQQHRRTIGVRQSLAFAYGKASGILRIASSMIVRLTLCIIPFLLVGGAIYYFLLTDNDINYYLQKKPPKFWIAFGLIGVVLCGMLYVSLRLVIRWFLALPLHLFENIDARQCLKESQTRLHGKELSLATYLIAWIGLSTLVASVLTTVVLLVAHVIVPQSPDSLIALGLAIGCVLLAWSVVNYVANSLSVISLSLLVAHFFALWKRDEVMQTPGASDETGVSLRLTRGRLVSGALIAFLVALLIGFSAIHSIDLEDNVEVTAHRGASIRAPENSLASVTAAIEDGADWVEIDVQESSDGIVIVAHDSDLKKIGGGPEKIWESTATELRSVDIGSYFAPEFSDERVPTLAEVLQACRGKVGVNIELKYYGHDEDLERRVIQIVEENDMVDQVVFMSLEADKVQKLRGLRPDWTVGLLTAVAIGGLDKAEADFLAVNTSLATQSFVASAHRAGKKVSVWTVNDRSTMSLMISRGVDNLITDDPALARDVIRERALMSPIERLLITLGERSGIVSARSANQ